MHTTFLLEKSNVVANATCLRPIRYHATRARLEFRFWDNGAEIVAHQRMTTSRFLSGFNDDALQPKGGLFRFASTFKESCLSYLESVGDLLVKPELLHRIGYQRSINNKNSTVTGASCTSEKLETNLWTLPIVCKFGDFVRNGILYKRLLASTVFTSACLKSVERAGRDLSWLDKSQQDATRSVGMNKTVQKRLLGR